MELVKFKLYLKTNKNKNKHFIAYFYKITHHKCITITIQNKNNLTIHILKEKTKNK